jgi:hypothetical protein
VRLHEHGLGIPLSEVGFPIRKSTDQSFFAAPRGLSQRSTSFIASQRQGIHRMPLSHLITLIINAHSPRQVTVQTPCHLRRRPSRDGRRKLAKGSSSGLGTDRKTSLLRDRPARRAVKRAYRIWVSDAAHHCVQRRNDLLFTMSDNMHRVIEDRRDTRFRCMDDCSGSALGLRGPPSLRFGATAFAIFSSQSPGLPSPSRGAAKAGGARRDRTDDLLLAKQALSQLSYGPVEGTLE